MMLMAKKIFILFFSILVVSCKKESEDLLTSGKWILNNPEFSSKETIQFYDDGTYVINLESTILRVFPILEEMILTPPTVNAKIIGNWIRQNNQISFISTTIDSLEKDVPDIDVNISDSPDIKFVDVGGIDIPVKEGYPPGSFFGYKTEDLNDGRPIPWKNVFPDIELGKTELVVWTIKTLTKKELIVESKGKILSYYRE